MITFQEYFAEAARLRWDAHEAAMRLLKGMQRANSHSRVMGVCQITHHIPATIEQLRGAIIAGDEDNDLDRIEVVRSDIDLTPVPSETWVEIECVDRDLTSHWRDDDEKPHEWREVDWLAGTFRALRWPLISWVLDRDDWWMPNNERVATVTIQFTALKITPTLRDEVLFYTDDEVVNFMKAWDGGDGTKFEKHIKDDPKSNHKQEELRALWKKHRPPSKVGRPRKPLS